VGESRGTNGETGRTVGGGDDGGGCGAYSEEEIEGIKEQMATQVRSF